MVQPARLELAQEKSHYPLKVACLPIPPWLRMIGKKPISVTDNIISVKNCSVKIFF